MSVTRYDDALRVMISKRFTSLLLVNVAFASLLSAQVRTESAPADNYLLRVTQKWGRESTLGDARALNLSREDGAKHENEQRIRTFNLAKRTDRWLILQDQSTTVTRRR